MSLVITLIITPGQIINKYSMSISLLPPSKTFLYLSSPIALAFRRQNFTKTLNNIEILKFSIYEKSEIDIKNRTGLNNPQESGPARARILGYFWPKI